MIGIFAAMPTQKPLTLQGTSAPWDLQAVTLTPSLGTFPRFSLVNETVRGNISGHWDGFV